MRHVHAFILGMYEFRRCLTTHFDDDALLASYDWGREWAHRLTLRAFDEFYR